MFGYALNGAGAWSGASSRLRTAIGSNTNDWWATCTPRSGYPQPGTPGYTGLPIYPGQPWVMVRNFETDISIDGTVFGSYKASIKGAVPEGKK